MSEEEKKRQSMLLYLDYAENIILAGMRSNVVSANRLWPLLILWSLFLNWWFDLQFHIGILLFTLLLVFGWLITAPRLTILYFQQKRHVTHIKQMIEDGESMDAIREYIFRAQKRLMSKEDMEYYDKRYG